MEGTDILNKCKTICSAIA